MPAPKKRGRKRYDVTGMDPERELKLRRNRQAAHKSREKKKIAHDKMREEIVAIHNERTTLRNQLIKYIELLENSYKENSKLRAQIDAAALEGEMIRNALYGKNTSANNRKKMAESENLSQRSNEASDPMASLKSAESDLHAGQTNVQETDFARLCQFVESSVIRELGQRQQQNSYLHNFHTNH